ERIAATPMGTKGLELRSSRVVVFMISMLAQLASRMNPPVVSRPRRDRARRRSATSLLQIRRERRDAGVSKIRENAVDTRADEDEILGRRITLVEPREILLLIAERIRVHEEAGLVGVLDEARRRDRVHVGERGVTRRRRRYRERHHLRFPRADAVGIRLD